jgi:hypothetical protein
MKKFWDIIDFLWENEILTAFAYLATLGWFAYAANTIRIHGNTLGKILFFAWSIVLAFIWLCHKANKE